jgi:hypothetical protein
MANKKNYQENELVKQFLTKYTEVNGQEKAGQLSDKVIGNNGYEIGQQFTLLGTIDFKEQTINGNKAVYWYLPTKEGVDLSLMSLMGVSSLKGYSNESVEVEYYTVNGTGKNAKDEKKTRTVTPDYLPEDNDFSEVWQPASRHLLTLVAMIADGDVDLKDKVVTFLGTAVKSIKAKQDGKQNGETYRAEYKRAIETKLWSIR